MELWNKIRGAVQMELTAADPESLLAEAAAKGITLWNVNPSERLAVSFWIPAQQTKKMIGLAKSREAGIDLIGKRGLVFWLVGWRRRPVLLATLLMLTAMTLFLPGRILFVQVTGNDQVPTRLIREIGAQYGLSFFCSRREVRSEQLKNELLGALEQLQWVGVNTSGSVATISVRERLLQPKEQESSPCDLVSVCDAVVDSVTLIRGEGKIVPRQAVKQGQILVSGFLDLGICTRVVEAEGEVYGRTLRKSTAVLPEIQLRPTAEEIENVKYSLLVGKKRINLYSDSGILMPTCGKMSKIYQLRLPGGFSLPVALIAQVYTVSELRQEQRSGESVQNQLYDAALRHTRQSMTAGTVLSENSEILHRGNVWVCEANWECREMIARRSEGVYVQDYG